MGLDFAVDSEPRYCMPFWRYQVPTRSQPTVSVWTATCVTRPAREVSLYALPVHSCPWIMVLPRKLPSRRLSEGLGKAMTPKFRVVVQIRTSHFSFPAVSISPSIKARLHVYCKPDR